MHSDRFAPDSVRDLDSLGWNTHFSSAFDRLGEPGTVPARIARADLGRYLVLCAAGERFAELSGRFRHRAAGPADLPVVGDWVALRPQVDGPGQIVALLPRTAAFARKTVGDTTEEQLLAANIDTVFLVTGLDANFNLRRIERYLTATWESGGNPVVVLNKADLATDLESQLAETEAIAMGVPVVAISALDADRLDALTPWLIPGATVVLLGSSGVGKSTLTNALLGAARQEIGATREVDAKGRHTTTSRELVVLPSGALLIDTPGMRELQLWGEESSLEQVFPEILALVGGCRFHDCAHESEPGCAVLEALEAGRLEPERFHAWRKLQRELERLERRRDVRARLNEKAKWKQIAQAKKSHPKAQRWR